MSEQTQFIVYACPIGPLNDQIESYYARTEAAFGPNKAHDYKPHCTLTGFFWDDATAGPLYIAALEKAAFEGQADRATVTVTDMLTLPDWVGLTIEAEELRQRIAAFIRYAESPTRREGLRLKDNLHVSLAYGFPPEQAADLGRIAREMVDPHLPARWELRFYERRPNNQWSIHYARLL